jgi:ACS family sodium-dependent inorganic phosphate cotransporter
VLIWSVFTILTPLAAQYGITALVLCRLFLGMGEGVSLPTLHHITARWAPANERSRFVTACSSGQFCGTAVTLLCAPLVPIWWPSIFILFGALGFVWLGLWMRHAASTPAEHPRIWSAEREYIEKGLPPLPPVETIPWRRLFTEPACIAIYIVHVSHNWSSYFGLMWLPKYLVDVVHIPLESSGLVLLLPYVMPFLGCVVWWGGS